MVQPSNVVSVLEITKSVGIHNQRAFASKPLTDEILA